MVERRRDDLREIRLPHSRERDRDPGGGAQLTDADGNWAIPMSLGPKQITRFVFDSAAATLDSLDGDYDLGFNGTMLLIK